MFLAQSADWAVLSANRRQHSARGCCADAFHARALHPDADMEVVVQLQVMTTAMMSPALTRPPLRYYLSVALPYRHHSLVPTENA
jgi:hypothetical protein